MFLAPFDIPLDSDGFRRNFLKFAFFNFNVIHDHKPDHCDDLETRPISNRNLLQTHHRLLAFEKISPPRVGQAFRSFVGLQVFSTHSFRSRRPGRGGLGRIRATRTSAARLSLIKACVQGAP